jgi:hypothetical protein
VIEPGTVQLPSAAAGTALVESLLSARRKTIISVPHGKDRLPGPACITFRRFAPIAAAP